MAIDIIQRIGKDLTLLAASLTLAACATSRPLGGRDDLAVLPGTELPKPSRGDLVARGPNYYVGPFDRLTIDVFGIEELSDREVQVDSSGRISFPLAGVIAVGGLEPREIEGRLRENLMANHIRDPRVTVNLKEAISQYITVEGEVKKPGLYPVVGEMTLLKSVAKAEGVTEFAQLKDVVVFRTVDNKDYAALYNLDAIRHGTYADPEIYSGDIVMIGESRGRRMFKDILAATPAIVTPLVIGLDRLGRN